MKKMRRAHTYRFLNIVFQIGDLQLFLQKLPSTPLFRKRCCFTRPWVCFPPLDASVTSHRGKKAIRRNAQFSLASQQLQKCAHNCSQIGQGEKLEIELGPYRPYHQQYKSSTLSSSDDRSCPLHSIHSVPGSLLDASLIIFAILKNRHYFLQLTDKENEKSEGLSVLPKVTWLLRSRTRI